MYVYTVGPFIGLTGLEGLGVFLGVVCWEDREERVGEDPGKPFLASGCSGLNPLNSDLRGPLELE